MNNNTKIYTPIELIKLAPTKDALKKLISFSEDKPLGDKGMFHNYVKFNGSKLIIQTSTMKNIAGLKQWPVDKNKPELGTNDNIVLSYKSDEENQAFNKFNRMLDELLVEFAMGEYSMMWLKKDKPSKDVVEDKYSKIVKSDSTGKYPDTFTVALKKYEGRYSVELYDKSKQRVSEEDFGKELEKGSEQKCLIIYQSIWHGKSGFGLKLVPIQIQSFTQSKIRGFAFIEDDAEITESVAKLSVEEAKPAVATPPAKTPVKEDSSSESDSDSDSDSSSSSSSDSDAKSKKKVPAKKTVKK
jgi:hypothetical protein